MTDLAGSTRLWDAQPDTMPDALARHDEIIRLAVEDHGGIVFKNTGDGICAAFGAAPDGVRAAHRAWTGLRDEPWGEIGSMRARMALHTGAAELRGNDYFGPTLNRCARLMASAHGGQAICSRASAELVRDALPIGVALLDLGDHLLRDLSRPERVFELRFPGQLETFPPLRSLGAFCQNLPVQLTSFIGREREVDDVVRLLESTRLVTLVGPGGVGKTRLAVEAARVAAPRFRHGVVYGELAPIVEPAAVPEVVACAFGLAGDGSRRNRSSQDTLVSHLAERRALLVLDNCEHLLGACAALIERLLLGCPELVVLTTTREPLGVTGERIWQVRPLALPESSHLPDVANAESVRLFVERAVAVAPGFSFETNASAIAEICRRLDGTPLALELAAARVRHLSPAQIDAHLEDRSRLLGLAGRSSEQRHRSIEAAIDWSHALLVEPERTLFRRLAVFVGGWALEAAVGVAGSDGLPESSIIDLMSSLVDKSLVLYEASAGAMRYRLLEPVRQYALARLDNAGETDMVRDRHRDWFVRHAAEVALRPFGSLLRRSAALAGESANLRSALDRCLEQRETAAALRLGARLWGSALSLGRYADTQQWIDRLLAALGPPKTEEDLALLLGGAHVAIWLGDFEATGQRAEDVLRLASTPELEAIVPTALMIRALACVVTRCDDPARLLRESLMRAETLRDEQAAGEALWLLGDLALIDRDAAGAIPLIERAIDVLGREAPHSSVMAHSLLSLAVAAHLRGDGPRAARSAEQALLAARKLGAASGYPSADLLPKATATTAIALAGLGRGEEADELLLESMRETERSGLPLAMADCLVAFAAVAFLRRDAERSARLLGAARSLMAPAGAWRRMSTGALYVHFVGKVRDALSGAATAKRLRDEGRALSREAAVEYALASLGSARSHAVEGVNEG